MSVGEWGCDLFTEGVAPSGAQALMNISYQVARECLQDKTLDCPVPASEKEACNQCRMSYDILILYDMLLFLRSLGKNVILCNKYLFLFKLGIFSPNCAEHRIGL